MADNEKQNNPVSTAAPSGNNGQRHGHHGNRHGHHGGKNGQKQNRQNREELDQQIAEGIAAAHTADSSVTPPQGNRPRNNCGAPRSNNGNNGANDNRNNGKNRHGDRQNNPAGSNPPKQGQKQNRGTQQRNEGAHEDAVRKGKQDRNRRRDRRDNDRRKEQAAAETAVPESLITESFLSSKDDGFFSVKKAEDDSLLDSMPPDPTLDAVFGDPEPAKELTEGTEIVGIHFPQGGKVYYFDPVGIVFPKGSYAIVETARGQELGEVAIANCRVAESSIVQPLKPVIRQATKEDVAHAAQNTARETEALEICKKKIANHKLNMKLTGAQYTFDNAKLIFYFTAAQRVDFRELVKDLATTFHTRIELRQIGTRDEAKMVGGFGMCGRALCCASFLPNYCQATIKMAKHQGLALNSSKLSGICGRLMCCLKYEDSTYARELALMPTVGSTVETPDGKGAITEVRPVGYTVRVKLEEKPEAAPKQFRLEDIKVLVRAAEQVEEEPENTDNED